LENFLSCGCGRFALLEAFAAKHRTALRWLERDSCFPLAAGADGLGFYPLVVAAILRQSQCLGAFTLAVLAAFRFVLELFVVEEELFTSGENEVGATIHTLENFVLEVHLRVSPFLHSHPGIRPEHTRVSMEVPEVNPYPSGSAHAAYAVFTTKSKFL
jgi:hypothetical protein